MYQNNGYSGDGGEGNFPGNFNNQNNFQPFAGSPGGQYSLQQQQQQQHERGMLHYEEPDAFMNIGNRFQPEAPLLNQQAFAQNGFMPPVTQVSDSSKVGSNTFCLRQIRSIYLMPPLHFIMSSIC